MTADPADTLPLENYWRQARLPLTSLAFVSPLLVVYELGMLLAGPQALRNGADVWLRQLLDVLGLSQYLLLPALTAGILLAWHHTTGERWRVSPPVLYGMAAESLVLAVCLVGIARAQSSLLTLEGAPFAAATAEAPGFFARLVLYIGAGIYEELLFRLILLSALAWTLRSCGATRGQSYAAAIVVTSVLFSLAHYVGPHGDEIRLASFVFRSLAGAFFAVLFVARGFGIAVGAHAGYDILVGLLGA